VGRGPGVVAALAAIAISILPMSKIEIEHMAVTNASIPHENFHEVATIPAGPA
jgi:hypothetical protein